MLWDFAMTSSSLHIDKLEQVGGLEFYGFVQQWERLDWSFNLAFHGLVENLFAFGSVYLIIMWLHWEHWE